MANITQVVKEIRRALSSFDISKAIELSDNEAKTRMYLVEPFFERLGYNRGFENGNIVPEYDVDFANLKGKKVDYAIQFRGKPEVIVEVKKSGMSLNDKHLSQLNEYFNNTNESKIGILTNGIEYKFYCRNNNGGSGLHPTPFFSFDWTNVDSNNLEDLAEFYATQIDTKRITDEAQDLFFLEGFEVGLYKELADPSRDFVKSIYARMGGSRMTEKVEKQVKSLINAVSLKTAVDKLMLHESKSANSGIITTDEELKVYHVIKTILAHHKLIDTNSICFKDLKGKFSIFIDDKQKKKVCDLYITASSQRIDIDGVKHEISGIDSIMKLKKQLLDKALSIL